jgi:Protein of unknown function (DUF3306)
MADGFLGRWAKRKEAVRKGEEVAPEPVKEVEARVSPPQPAPADLASPPVEAQAPPPPTLEDVQALTADSDFSRFVKPDVSPEVKNAAMKKLFSDPHFNVMDRLDTYIDDYGKPDPLPPEWLRQMASVKFLNLFAKEEKEEQEERDRLEREKQANAPTGREVADVPPAETVAQSNPAVANQAVPPAAQHADPDLRLQQDDAPGPEVPGAGSR